MGMFTNYENLANNYSPNNICSGPPKCHPDEQKLNPCNPNKPYSEYNIEGELVGYFWYYGDAVDLEFNIDGQVTYEGNDSYVTAEDFLKDKQIVIRLFNFRRELLDERYYKGSTKVIYSIDKDFSKKLVRSTYYISVLVTNSNDLNYTLFAQQDCTLIVK